MKPISEVIAGLFYDTMRVCFNVSMKQNQIDALNKNSVKFAEAIRTEARKESVKTCAKLSEATKEGFLLIGKDLENLTNRVGAQEELAAEIEKLSADLTAHISRMEIFIKGTLDEMKKLDENDNGDEG